jgi:AbiV family abortive infection protein
MSPKILQTRDLLRGAAYAVEQSGHLLRDAVILYENGSYASAVVLAVYCREELGRSELLLDLAKASSSDGGITSTTVRSVCEQHLDKLAKGRTGTSLRIAPAQTARLRPLFTNERTPERAAARAALDRAIKAKSKRKPADTHERRLRALYVDALDDGSWYRPTQEPPSAALDLLNEIAGDYALTLDRIQNGDHELSGLLGEWPEAPELLPPAWPGLRS